jgi:AraC-like DNA-binding protein/mannose-6-phosphate isomerase-like protein (cupin superfamily)
MEYKPHIPNYGILIESHHHGPDFRTARHQHAYDSLVYVVEGRGVCNTDGNSYKLRPDTAMMLRSRQNHQFIDTPKHAMTVFVVYLGKKIAEQLKEMLSEIEKTTYPLSLNPYQAKDVRGLLREMLYEQSARPLQYEAAIQNCFAAIVLKLYRAATEKTDSGNGDKLDDSLTRVKAALEYAAEHYYEPQDLAQAAKMAYLSQRQFSTVVRKLEKKSFARFLAQIRIEKAAHLLRSTSMPVSAIAFEVGFEDLSTFYRTFRKYVGTVPLEFRSQRPRK